jgi:hypothetical protein
MAFRTGTLVWRDETFTSTIPHLLQGKLRPEIPVKI